MLSGDIMIYFSLLVLHTKKSFQVLITSDRVNKFLGQFIAIGKRLSDLCRGVAKVPQV